MEIIEYLQLAGTAIGMVIVAYLLKTINHTVCDMIDHRCERWLNASSECEICKQSKAQQQ